ncbi:ABC transporter permease [Roseateles asaccharophilus]|uniref:ABC transport system permease protein n=1 Tax=Roseateles asaccharophilus TaxID=582607 RepID=A0ABU2ACM0_9BURK|nr:ABC transporter permease [Roseateles asaccharophilus]MDR7334951.1 putative ABC transport system permease protein [Roseateles asaccharophilus]
MKYLHLIWAALFRRKGRTFLTLVSIITAFLLFGLLDAVRVGFDQAGKSADGAQRLQTGAKLSFIQLLPMSLGARITQIDGVKDTTFANWFGGAYQKPENQVFSFAVAPNYLDIYPEMEVSAEHRKAFAETKDGALVGEGLAKRFGWKVGDQVPMQSTIFPDRSGSQNWPFKIAGIIKVTDKKTSGWFDQVFLLNWKYFDDTTPWNNGQVGWYVTRVKDVNQADRIAKAIDAMSMNSANETRTQTEAAATAAWMKQLADINLIVTSIMGAVFFTLLLLAGNTMMQAVRERTGEIAVLKTLGFSGHSVLAMVLAEAVLLLVIGGVVGLGLASVVGPAVGAASNGALNLPAAGAASWAIGVGLMLLFGLLVGLLPALNAMRLNITDALAGRA